MVVSDKLKVNYSRTLKLSNVLIRELPPDDFENYFKAVELMETYIKTKGAQPMGPLIHYTTVKLDEAGQSRLVISLMRQSNTCFHKVEAPYSMESVIRVPDCLYVRFAAEEEKLKFAYDKLTLISFEEDIPLVGDVYTIFVDKNEDMLVADVFMEKAKNG